MKTYKPFQGNLNPPQRGAVEQFSEASALRLRKLLVTQAAPKSTLYAVTLTTPDEPTPEEWRKAMERFRVTLSRKMPSSAMVWRVELQKRGVPHLHCLLWCAAGEEPETVRAAWLAALRLKENKHARRYAVKIEQDRGGDTWGRYLLAHTVKHKREQLGWKGRQWGVFNPDNLQPVEPLGLHSAYLHAPGSMPALLRVLSRITGKNKRRRVNVWFGRGRVIFGTHADLKERFGKLLETLKDAKRPPLTVREWLAVQARAAGRP